MLDKRPLFIITARAGSSRLPGKVLKKFWKQYCMLEFLILRFKSIHEASRLVLATPDTHENDSVADIGIKSGITVIRGPENNVVDRMYQCYLREQANFIVRITADNPFTDPTLAALQLKKMIRVDADYSYCKKCPSGTAVDIWTADCFEATVNNANSQYEREHVNAHVWNSPETYKILWFGPLESYVCPELNLSVDTVNDFERVKKFAGTLDNPLNVNIEKLISLKSLVSIG